MYRRDIILSPVQTRVEIISDLSQLDSDRDYLITESAVMRNEFSDACVVVEGGETMKKWDAAEHLIAQFINHRLDRESRITVVGGGALCDVASFAASIYLRGVGLQLVPTTLLSMVDASIGGKTGINFRGLKNMVGSFYPACRVCIYPDFLQSLPEREYKSGLVEVIKAGMLNDATLLTLLEQSSEDIFRRKQSLLQEEIIPRAVEVKAAIVEADQREEKGLRSMLNLGHSFAHALEASMNPGHYTHGEAVAWGIRVILWVGTRMGVTSSDYMQRIHSLLDKYGHPSVLPANKGRLREALGHDKKRRGNTLRFVLQSKLGENLLSPIPDLLLQQAIDQFAQ